MNKWLRRALILLIILIWLVLLMTPALAFVLARNGQFQIGPTDGRHWRLFLLSDADAEGLGLERSRQVASPIEAPPSVRCLRTSVNYWMWTGIGSNTDFCQCADSATGEMTNFQAPACRPQ
jgi:hypothetical protein